MAGMAPRSRIAAAIAVSTAIAACGSSSPGSHNASSTTGHPNAAQVQTQLHHELLSFAGCMRSHGVSNFPDPTSPGQDKEFLLGQIPGINQHSPAFVSGHTACEHLLPGGGVASPTATAQVMHQLVGITRCLRAHGLSGFPDPVATRPSDQAAYGGVIGFGPPNGPPGAPPVAYLLVPKSLDTSSPAAERAATACHFRLQ
jgi:hypothetical protein